MAQIKPKFDLKNSKRYLDRIKTLEGNQHCKVLKDPVPINLTTGGDVFANSDSFVATIGINDSYLVVQVPAVDWYDVNESYTFNVFWTKTDTHKSIHAEVSMAMLNWMILRGEDSDFVKVKHSDFRVTDAAIDVIIAKRGKEFLEARGEVLKVIIQGRIVEDFKNPYYVPKK